MWGGRLDMAPPRAENRLPAARPAAPAPLLLLNSQVLFGLPAIAAARSRYCSQSAPQSAPTLSGSA